MSAMGVGVVNGILCNPHLSECRRWWWRNVSGRRQRTLNFSTMEDRRMVYRLYRWIQMRLREERVSFSEAEKVIVPQAFKDPAMTNESISIPSRPFELFEEVVTRVPNKSKECDGVDDYWENDFWVEIVPLFYAGTRIIGGMEFWSAPCFLQDSNDASTFWHADNTGYMDRILRSPFYDRCRVVS